MALRRFLGLPGVPEGWAPAGPGVGHPAPSDAETATVRQIVARLNSLPPERARHLAAFAYILSRAAHADLAISDVEVAEMERLLVKHGHLPEPEAVVATQIARAQSLLFGGTEDFLVTREFRAISTDAERLDLLRCCYLVSAAEDGISAEEASTLSQIASELDIEPVRLHALQAEFANQLNAIRALRRHREQSGPG